MRRCLDLQARGGCRCDTDCCLVPIREIRDCVRLHGHREGGGLPEATTLLRLRRVSKLQAQCSSEATVLKRSTQGPGSAPEYCCCCCCRQAGWSACQVSTLFFAVWYCTGAAAKHLQHTQICNMSSTQLTSSCPPCQHTFWKGSLGTKPAYPLQLLTPPPHTAACKPAGHAADGCAAAAADCSAAVSKAGAQQPEHCLA